MKTIYSTLALFLIFSIQSQSQVSVTSSGVPAVYATLQQAFNAVNGGVQFGVVNISVTASTTELVPAVLNASGAGAANYTSVNILPTAAVTISGNINGPLVTLNGAQNVVFDGRIGGVGVTRSLTIQNTSNLNAATISTIHFTNGAANNRLRYLNIQGSGRANSSSTILFSATSATQGNSNNIISNNDIGAAGANIPFTAISSAGAPLSNNNNSVTNNQVHDFFNPAGISSGVRCGTNSSGWTISGNSFYHTTPKVSTANTVHNIIYVFSGIGYTIANNFIGGSLPNAGGGAASISGNFYNLVAPMLLQNLDFTSVDGNTITNFNIASNPISNTSIFNGIQTFGNINVGSISGNTIGSLTGTGAITITVLGNNPCAVLGIVSGGATYAMDISNNNIGSFTINGIGSGISGFTGISTDNHTVSIINNTIGGTTAGSIQSNKPLGLIAGISMFQNINVIDQGCFSNTIQNFTNNGVLLSSITGILSQIIAENVNTANIIIDNTITTLTSSNGGSTVGSVQGIVITQSAGFSFSSSNGDINSNRINTLVSASTGGTSIVRGISHENAYPSYLSISANDIHTLSSAAPNPVSGSTGVVQGIASIIPSNGGININDNLIYDLQNTSAASTTVLGIGCIHYNDGDPAAISKNRIYNLRNPNAAATGLVAAIDVSGSTGVGTFIISNNMLSLSPANVQAYGIHTNLAATQINMFFNSIVIAGTAAGTNNSGAFFRDGVATGVTINNNIFHNTRTGGTGNHYSILNTDAAPATGWVTDYNDLYSSNPATIVLWGGTAMDLTTYKATSFQDANSKSFSVMFVDAANADLHLGGASIGDQNLGGTYIIFFDDYDGEGRSAIPYMGADEIVLSPLPVTIEYFRGKTQNNANVLNWKISCGSSSVTFDLQRSSNGRDFSSIGNFTVMQERCDLPFDFTDTKPLSGTNYYRLKMSESSGEVTYSNIISVINKKNGFELVRMYPTSVKNKAVITVTSAVNTNIEFLITDVQGKHIRKQSASVNAGSSNLDMNFSALANGIYQLTAITSEGNKKTIQFVKQ